MVLRLATWATGDVRVWTSSPLANKWSPESVQSSAKREIQARRVHPLSFLEQCVVFVTFSRMKLRNQISEACPTSVPKVRNFAKSAFRNEGFPERGSRRGQIPGMENL